MEVFQLTLGPGSPTAVVRMGVHPYRQVGSVPLGRCSWCLGALASVGTQFRDYDVPGVPHCWGFHVFTLYLSSQWFRVHTPHLRADRETYRCSGIPTGAVSGSPANIEAQGTSSPMPAPLVPFRPALRVLCFLNPSSHGIGDHFLYPISVAEMKPSAWPLRL